MNQEKRDRRIESRRIGDAMRDLIHVFRSRFEEEFRPSGITLPQLRLLKAVQQQQERSAASIARDCQLTPQTLHTMLTRAAREGWITRGVSDQNHRFVTATLTVKGEALLQKGLELREAIEADLWRTLSLKSMRQVRKALEAGLANLADSSSAPHETRSHPKP